MLHFFDLPTEIFLEILCYLRLPDLHRCSRVCHLLKDTIDGALHIQYQMQLELAGMQNNPNSKACIASRLDLLKAREEAWKTLDWSFVTKITVPCQSSGVYDLTPSVYLLGKTLSGDVFETTGIQSVQLPARFPEDLETVAVEWNEFDFGMHIIDFGTAIEEHDLMVCVSSVPDEDDRNVSHIVAVLLRYSTKRTHDDCQNPVIPICRARASQGQPSISIEVVGENLALTVVFNQDRAMSSDYLYIFDWKTGRSKCHPVQIYNIGLVFLREDILVNPNIVRKSLDIYHIPPSSLLSLPTASTSVRLLQSLILPSLKLGQRITSISCRSDPNPTANAAFPKYTRPTRPYANDSSDAIMIMTLEVSPFNRGSSRNYVMIVHRRALLHLAISALPRKSGKGLLNLVAWDTWGPPVTRWFNADDFSTVFITATSGQRYVQLTPSERGHPRGSNIPLPRDTIHVLDFNPWHVHLARRNPDPRELIVGVVDPKEGEKEREENICHAHEAFAQDIVGRLPYVRCTSEEKWEFYEAVLMDEERILGVSKYLEDAVPPWSSPGTWNQEAYAKVPRAIRSVPTQLKRPILRPSHPRQSVREESSSSKRRDAEDSRADERSGAERNLREARTCGFSCQISHPDFLISTFPAFGLTNFLTSRRGAISYGSRSDFFQESRSTLVGNARELYGELIISIYADIPEVGDRLRIVDRKLVILGLTPIASDQQVPQERRSPRTRKPTPRFFPPSGAFQSAYSAPKLPKTERARGEDISLTNGRDSEEPSLAPSKDELDLLHTP
ncbi:unnamed protein product [Cyclocybe aegerita]|uniref:F-box domain-containing protein n=1 Tax=Cyclocybe aegerita TaxID=1973307 RepID=A0A8S0W3S6_CYCAE|nr:unnamed protein product [Cyclocybe aegerita]